ncbi:nitroreductase family protein [Oceanispirochaeta sp.]|jgi:nitroreductase|uniref:nitroreductase family protein n=1 Tax=Oceanispirochaeta sp. TaxID=2035350 RepID=UPI0026138354|nr:nitroreductase family protein [Oceanispirochaeta sp.]MDA3956506.1 nitroreductase family protein [Oceanispirochaeta sp.]
MELIPEIKNRVTAGSFQDLPIPEDSLDRVLNAGRIAPSAKNRQPWRFIVLKDPEIKEKLKNSAYGDERFSEAPVVIAACTTNIGYRMPNGELSYPMDLSFAISFMMIQAEHENLGSALVTTYREDDVKNLLTIPYSMKVVMMLLIGRVEKPVDKETRLPVNRVIYFDQW